MANTIRIKRRAQGGASGAPSSLQNAELAFNEQDNILYYGFGTGGAGGSATSVIAIAGPGWSAPLASPAFTGAPTAPTAAADTSSTQLATTAFVVGQASSSTPLMNGVAAIGTSLKYARGDHVHATDTTRAPLASPTFTGTPAAPTAAVDTATTQLATTAYVVNQGYLKSATASTTYAPLASPTLTGTPAAPTAAVNTNTTQLATTAFVLAQAASTTPAALGTAAAGTGTTFARADHVHAMPSISGLQVPTANVAWNGYAITGLADPTNAQDAATKNYVDLAVQGLDPKQSVKAASTANIATLSGAMTVDGIALVAGDRVLVKDQTTQAQNGIYVVASGAWSRATDMDVWAEVPNAYVFVEQGTTNADNGYLCTTDSGGTLGTTAIVWVQFNGAGQTVAGAGLTKTGNQLDVGTASPTRIVVNADNIDLATTGVTAGTYKSVTTDTYGRITGGSNPTTLTGFGITDAQPLDATLTALAGVTTTADQVIYATGSNTFSVASLTAYGRSLIGVANAAAAQTTLGLGTIATQAASGVAITGGSITNLTTFDGITIDGGTF